MKTGKKQCDYHQSSENRKERRGRLIGYVENMAQSARGNVTPQSGVTRETCRMGIAHQK
jgi:hypothetical protein